MSKIKATSFKPKATVVGLMLAGMFGAGFAHAGAGPAIVKVGVPAAGAVIADGAVIQIWTADAVALPIPVQAGRDRDFLAIVDGEPYSRDYGKVIWTAELESLVAGGVPGAVLDSAAHNDPHHMTSYTSYTDWDTGRKYMYAGGVISKNVFRWDITSSRNISRAANVVCGTQPQQSSLTDDFLVMPNGNIVYTYMSNFGYSGNELGAGTPLGGGSIAEIYPLRTSKRLINLLGVSVCLPGVMGGASESMARTSGNKNDTYLGEYQVAPNAGPSANVSRKAPADLHKDTQPVRSDGSNKGLFFFGNTNAAKEGLPHGMVLSYDAKYLVAADYSVAVSIGAAAANLINNIPGLTTFLSRNLTFSTFGVAVRAMKVNPATLDPVPAYVGGNPAINTYNENNLYPLGSCTTPGVDCGVPATVDPGVYMQSISVVPDGPRREFVAFHEEPEGLMPFAMFHQGYHCPDQKGWNPGADKVFGTADDPLGDTSCAGQEIDHHGASANSMCGGAMFYSANVRLPQSANSGAGPRWHAIYDVGPCSGVSYHAVIDDDRFVVQPIAGIESPNQQDVLIPPVFDRDYPRQHSRRMITFDFRPLLAKGNGISGPDCNGSGEVDEDDLACGAVFTDPIQCHYPGVTTRIRPSGAVDLQFSSVGRSINDSGFPSSPLGDGFGNTTPGLYAAKTGTPAAAPWNRLVHNNRAHDCPRVLSAVGQFETGTWHTEKDKTDVVGIGEWTTGTANEGAYPGVAYAQFATVVTKFHTDTEVGGAPTLTNLNTAQNINTNGGPHFTHQDRLGFCVPTGATANQALTFNGQNLIVPTAVCKPGSYYDLTPDANTGSPKQIYPASPDAVVACAAGRTAFMGSCQGAGTALEGGVSCTPATAVDPSCVGRVMFIQYFVELQHVPAPGTGSDGDRTVCMLLVNRVTGDSMMDPFFVDELTKQPCLDFDGKHRERTSFALLGFDTCGDPSKPSVAGDYCWPGERRGKGGAKPHAGTFERDGANLFGPGYFPKKSMNLDGAL